jgi:hypothetical protein
MLWAEGMAYIPVCEDHLDTGRQVIEDDNNDEVVKILVIPAPEEDEEDEDEEALEAAFMPSRVPSGRPGGGQFAPKDASEQATADAEKKQADAEHQQAIQDAKDAAAQRLKNEEAIRQQKQAENRRRATQQEKDALRTEERNKREREREADRARRLREHEADRARRLAEHKQDRARMLRERATRAHQKATASRHRAKSTARKGSTAAKATYGTGNVVGYDQRTGTIHYADGSSFDGSTWKTKYGKRITASGCPAGRRAADGLPGPARGEAAALLVGGQGRAEDPLGDPGGLEALLPAAEQVHGTAGQGLLPEPAQALHRCLDGQPPEPGRPPWPGHLALAASGIFRRPVDGGRAGRGRVNRALVRPGRRKHDAEGRHLRGGRLERRAAADPDGRRLPGQPAGRVVREPAAGLPDPAHGGRRRPGLRAHRHPGRGAHRSAGPGQGASLPSPATPTSRPASWSPPAARRSTSGS